MPKYLAFLLGLLVVIAYVPGWSQPAMEPKSLMLLLVGGAAWVVAARRGVNAPRYPWALLLPMAWLLLSCLWSVSPLLGLQRVFWLLAASGLAAMLQQEDTFDAFMVGFLAGTTLHAALILAQWFPPLRPFLPPTLGSDPFQGVGRGFFHNTNMAFQPLLISCSWLLLSGRVTARRWAPCLLWLLPVIALTQSRFGTAVACLLLAYRAAQSVRLASGIAKGVILPGLAILLSILWSLCAHRWGWIFPLAGGLLGWTWRIRRAEVLDLGFSRWVFCGSLLLAVLVGVGGGVYSVKNRPSSHGLESVPAQQVVDASLSQRKSYYRVAIQALIDKPLWGQGLGSARALYPLYVDRDHPVEAIAYGDFIRPNNLHSEYLEVLMEGGLCLLAAVAIGFWMDRRKGGVWARGGQLAPLALFALMDFPFHNPVGLLWAGLCLVQIRPCEVSVSRPWGRACQGLLGLGLLMLGVGQYLSASRRSAVEAAFQSVQAPANTHRRAAFLWRIYPFSADTFDLYSKSAIQAAALPWGGVRGQDLQGIMAMDPWDHHILLACAQAAKREGDTNTLKICMGRYSQVAPRDPSRYLRLAKDAIRMGRVAQARSLILEAARQPGYTSWHQQQADLIGVSSGSPSSPDAQ